ncbi:MAG: hypothetical protein ACOX6P_01835 [Candidatus Merdivicinus sp.]|jgi:hypothetical protein
MFCPKCGYQTSENICPLCKTPISVQEQNRPPVFQQFHNPTGKQDPSQRTLHLLIVGGCIIFGFLFVVFYLFFFILGMLANLA